VFQESADVAFIVFAIPLVDVAEGIGRIEC